MKMNRPPSRRSAPEVSYDSGPEERDPLGFAGRRAERRRAQAVGPVQDSRRPVPQSQDHAPLRHSLGSPASEELSKLRRQLAEALRARGSGEPADNEHETASSRRKRRSPRGAPAARKPALTRATPARRHTKSQRAAASVRRVVKYGPTYNLSERQQQQLQKHYRGSKVPLVRQSQYSGSHQTYVDAARKRGVMAGSPATYTKQEKLAARSGVNAPNASINHLIASGTGQQALNASTLQFRKGKARTTAQLNPALVTGDNRRQLALGIAEQTAALGRMRGLGRAIIAEEPANQLQKRDAMARDLKAALDNRSVAGYRSYLKNTFDSVGNLRVGDRSLNSSISTGFDPTQDSAGQFTPRAKRLEHALRTFADPAVVESKGIFTTRNNDIMSSSTESPMRIDETAP